MTVNQAATLWNLGSQSSLLTEFPIAEHGKIWENLKITNKTLEIFMEQYELATFCGIMLLITENNIVITRCM